MLRPNAIVKIVLPQEVYQESNMVGQKWGHHTRSGAIRSMTNSRLRMTFERLPSTNTSAARGREL